MSFDQKYCLLNELIAPFGYAYLPSQDIFTSRIDCWQRDFGYCTLYDKAALHFHLIFDYLPIYFNYNGKTWLIEIWKGQYGINTGAEIGVYYADRILSKDEYTKTLFYAASECDMLPFSFQLFRNGRLIADISDIHWWLSAFRLGCFSHLNELCMRASITFPNHEMAQAFTDSLLKTGYCNNDACSCSLTVSFPFSKSRSHFCFMKRLYIAYVMWLNHILCTIFQYITRPFCMSVDQVLYLYYYLPFAFNNMLHIRKHIKFEYIKRRFL